MKHVLVMGWVLSCAVVVQAASFEQGMIFKKSGELGEAERVFAELVETNPSDQKARDSG